MTAAQLHRIDGGGRIDRTRRMHFSFDGRWYYGFAGDTLASALLANGVRVVGRSFKYHRPRGVLSAGVEEPNALIAIGEGGRLEPNVRATLLPLFDGLRARSQRGWPGVRFDLGRTADALHGLLPPAFYHKTFMWPSWHCFEGLIRRAAGVGPARAAADPDRYQVQNAHCDVLVIGAGPAGLRAALAAAESGVRVLLVEQDTDLGGSILSEPVAQSAAQNVWLVGVAARLQAMPNCRVLLRTTCNGVHERHVVTAVERVSDAVSGIEPIARERYWRIRAAQMVLATGAIEQPVLFPCNDLPGVMLAGSVRQYLNRYAVACGHKVAVVTNDDDAYRTALDLAACGVSIAAIFDSRPQANGALPELARAQGLPVSTGAQVTRALGGRRVTGMRVAAADGSVQQFSCDAIAMSSGWQPTLHLFCHAGGKLKFDVERQCFIPHEGPSNIRVVGQAAGVQVTVPDGIAAARGPTGARLGATHRSDRCWIDFQYDVTARDVEIAVRENYVSVEHLKRYTTVGMSVDQGKTSNLTALATLAQLTGRSIAETGTTTFRPPFAPVTLATIAAGRTGRFYRPSRELPTHALQAELGALFEEFGGWQRPVAYPHGGESLAAASEREVRAVRSSVGIFDGSPLGKILVRGPQAALLVDRLYANTMSTLAVGQARYGLMLNEQGVIIDDGVCARLADSEYWVSTTSAGATRIAHWIDEWLQCEWPELEAIATPVTSQWATVTLAGPRARDVFSLLATDIDVSAGACKHLQTRRGTLEGYDCRILRVSFSGELSYEINIPADGAERLWRKCLEAGRAFDITPFGIEALMTMRIEKGFLHVGSDTDGTTVPDDVGFGPAVAKKRADFIGRRSLDLPENRRADRLQYVGLRALNRDRPLVAGAHLVDRGSAGYVTSACFSPSLDASIGLALLRGGRARYGEKIRVFDDGIESLTEVLAPGLYDPRGLRIHG